MFNLIKFLIKKIKYFLHIECDHVFEEILDKRCEIQNEEDGSFIYIKTYRCKKCNQTKIVICDNVIKIK